MDQHPQASLTTTTIRSIQRRAERIRQQELTRHSGRLDGLNLSQQTTVQQLTQRLVDQLLMDPITCGTRLTAGPDGHRYVDLLRFLYALEQELASPAHDSDPDRRQTWQGTSGWCLFR
jgi:glutamyl-tRNA reductase